MRFFKASVFMLLTAATLVVTPSEARFRRYLAPVFPVENWQRGYWFHGTYSGHVGWWWIVGPGWYFYETPMYPYPPASAQPVYVVQVPNAPPPPPAAAPGPPTGTNSVLVTAPTAPTKSNGSAQAFSYYCEKSKNYFPLIKTCDGRWIATPVKPPN